MGDSPTGRQLLQLFGTNVIRQRFVADAWVRMAENRVRMYKGVTILDDVRFPNEAQVHHYGEQPKKRFDLLFKIVRPGVENLIHESETAVDTIPLNAFNAVFVNDGNIQALRTDVLKWLKANVYKNART